MAEFLVQELELDWTIGTRDADFGGRVSDSSYHTFRGVKWPDVKKHEQNCNRRHRGSARFARTYSERNRSLPRSLFGLRRVQR